MVTDELKILESVCNRLDAIQIPYMLTGSWAAHFYLVPRMTRDIDIVIEILTSDVHRILQLFQNDFYISKPAVIEAVEHQTMFNIIHNETAFKVDFIIRKDSLYRTTEFSRRRRLNLAGVEVWVVSPEDLIISKLFWAKDSLSAMQLRDVKNLISSIPQLDKEYIAAWIKKLDLTHVYEKING